MVAYSFKKQFIAPIQARTKQQTIRAERARHARPGEAIQLYFGMRTKHCSKIIPDVICLSTHSIFIDVCDGSVVLDGIVQGPLDKKQLALADGFGDWPQMLGFWDDTHGPSLFKGVLIKWREEDHG